jgi:misacylated tRNA(Ala) deacylase
MVKLLCAEKGKKGRSLLYFVVGDRVGRYLDSCYRRERQLTEVLRGGPDDHVELVSKAMKSLKVAQKGIQNALKEIAIKEAAEINQTGDTFAFMHK